MDIEQEAAALGHIPKEQWKGDPDKWTDAQEFVDRGKHLMPILRKNNEKLMGTIEQQQAEIGQLRNTVAGFDSSVKELMKFHEESTKVQVGKARAEILERIK